MGFALSNFGKNQIKILYHDQFFLCNNIIEGIFSDVKGVKDYLLEVLIFER
ncbi:hypothetical protein GXM_01883 [Nostoc sphaeroides CCNUC1]|uniref:Transposase n=1 Tax=Nostoc sphaeroides CCNUC1 TaxID=2653204 RepID=A0A5P8VVG2_9NOSO|nr:hypothetical protein GXM_01883 [Nostoc sphaeroides CCNUC1]